jgi:hypothetical protein
MENLRKKNQTEIQEIKSPLSQTKNTVEVHSRRLEQVEDRIPEHDHKTEKKEKIEELIVKQLKSCVRNTEELSNSNVRIMGIKEEEEVQVKRAHNIFNKMISEKFPNLENKLLIQVQEALRTTKM